MSSEVNYESLKMTPNQHKYKNSQSQKNRGKEDSYR